VHAHAALSERKRDATRPDPELEEAAVTGLVGQKLDDRVDDCGVSLIGVPLVELRCDPLAEVILGDNSALPDGDVLGALAGERLALPAAPALAQRQAGDASHQVELGGPDVAEGTG
jgi:hypothetical protein